MFKKRMTEMENHIETSAKLLPFLKKNFEECQDTLTVVMIDWDKHRAQIVHLGEKVIQLEIDGKKIGSLRCGHNYDKSWQRRRKPWRISKPLSKGIEKQDHHPLPLPQPTP
jgi:hypothetical protein